MPYVYAYDDEGSLYEESAVDLDPVTRLPEQGYTRYLVPSTITLTPDDVCRGHGNIIEVLVRAGQAVAR